MVRPERFELPTYCSGGNRSIQLSYGRALQEYYGKPVESFCSVSPALFLTDPAPPRSDGDVFLLNARSQFNEPEVICL